MSIIICDECGARYDSDFDTDCPRCADDELDGDDDGSGVDYRSL